MCRAERTERLDNDSRDSAPELLAFNLNGARIVPVSWQDFASAAVDTAEEQAAHWSRVAEAFERDVESVSRLLPSSRAATSVPLTRGARQLVAALSRITNMSLEDFRRNAVSVAPTSDEQPFVVTVRPARW